ncbi:hypothetical protein [Aeromonas sp. MrichA-1]|uniref:hypothetical protein n=1 Tax=Aeromonas sp. MrichA-1 TaxID=2823362 RepID=UPI001B328766|nr:hypothetical protein [Aeromonas sp. MrichA-1]MBP4081828.1 hypothetical protein [Aeromonas sp. MrichA-1]
MPQITESISKEVVSFERALSLLSHIELSPEKDENGEYISEKTQMAWWAWQASSHTSHDENKHKEFIEQFESEFKKTDFAKELDSNSIFERSSLKSGCCTVYVNETARLAWQIWNTAESLRSAGWGTERWDQDD